MSRESQRADRQELRELVELYARLADQHDGAALAVLFADHGVIEIFDDGMRGETPTRILDGRDEIAAEIAGLDQFRTTMHFLGQHHSRFAGPDVAHGETCCEASHVFALEDGSLVNHVVALRYFDDYVRTRAGWRFACRRLDFGWVEHRRLASPDELARVPGTPRG